jgi:ABC-2 type transport system ATP-binding protein
VIECRRLHREFVVDDATTTALDELDFDVEAGETRALLGPNGAGKTTLVRILSTVLLPSGGRARVNGFDVVESPQDVRRSVRMSLGGDRGFHFGLSVFENIRFWGTMYGLGWRAATEETHRVLELVGMVEQASTRADSLSRGMKQRVHLARALLGDAPLLLLDEPTTGMDPVAARSFRELIGELQAGGRTILLTTHNLAEAEELADRVTMLNHGRVEATDTPAGLRRLFADRTTVVASGVPPELHDSLRSIPGVIDVRLVRDQVAIDIGGETRPVLELLVGAGVSHLRSEPPTLEQVYLQVFGNRGMSV